MKPGRTGGQARGRARAEGTEREEETRVPIGGRLLEGRGQGKHANRANLAWWREARFGMFIHWGLYALPAGRWKGEDVPGIGEWIMHRRRIPVRDYEKLARHFNPVRFDADAWVRLARDAGMRYLVITAKHHEGFAMFRTACTGYNVVDATPWKRDPMADLAAACRRHGVRLGFYYSQDQDWHDPDGSWNDWDFDPSKKDFGRYLTNKVEPQLGELLTQYGPVSLVWFDTPYTMTRAHSARLRRLVNGIQPRCLVSGRIGHDLGDYGSLGDNQIPVGRVGGDYETPVTMNDTWGYKRRDHNWKSTATLLRLLVDLSGKGINCILNVGPTARGEIPGPSVTRLREIGSWMRVNGESIHGTGAGPFPYELPWGRITQKPGRLYLHVFEWPGKSLDIHGLDCRVRRAHLLADPGRQLSVQQRRHAGADLAVLTISGLGRRPDPWVSVVVLEIDGKARGEEMPVQQPDGSVLLPAFMARRLGPARGGFTVGRAGFTEKWRNAANGLSWTMKILEPGRYAVGVVSSDAPEHRPRGRDPSHRLLLTVGTRPAARLDFRLARDERVVSTRSRYYPEIVSHAGHISVPHPGIYSVQVRATTVSRRAAGGIGLSAVRLVPAPRGRK